MAKAGKDSPKKEKAESEFVEKVLFINRCSKVVKGGRKFSFAALVLVADNDGNVGLGFAKANELTDAIRKAGESGKKNMVACPKEGTTVPHDIRGRCAGSHVFVKPAPRGSGVIAGSSVRAIFEFAKVGDVMAKSSGSRNQINQAKAAFDLIKEFRTRSEIKKMRGIA